MFNQRRYVCVRLEFDVARVADVIAYGDSAILSNLVN